jgi:Trk K+ transport system NAD-binding subunit/nucleotide-binding universal stress UspA family protein
LDEVGVSDFDYVLALTGNDQVNLAIVRYAQTQGVNFPLALVNEQKNLEEFEDIEVRTIQASSLLGKSIFHYLQDPRIKMLPLELGHAEIIEVDISHHFLMVGQSVSNLIHENWRLVALLRDKELLFPEPNLVVQAQDRLIILGKGDVFNSVCNFLECGIAQFPLTYGQTLLVAIFSGYNRQKIIKESLYLVQNIKAQKMSILCSQQDQDIGKEMEQWSHFIDLKIEVVVNDFLSRIRDKSHGQNCGLVILDPFKTSFFSFLTKPVILSLAHSLPCPLLVTRYTYPYKRILVPFNNTPKTEKALEVGIDLAKQCGAELAVIVVEESRIVHGNEKNNWVPEALIRIRAIAHIHKMEMEEIVRQGNPVKEIVDQAKDYNLLIIGSTRKERGLFTPSVGEFLAQQSSCSVLVVAKTEQARLLQDGE